MKRTHRFCIAPMMEWTDRHCRFFHRLLTRRAALYRDGDDRRRAARRPRPVSRLLIRRSIRLRCSSAAPSRRSLRTARRSRRISATTRSISTSAALGPGAEGRFGACLMGGAGLVGDCVAAMKARVTVPVTVKCRIGIDEQDAEEALDVHRAVEDAGVDGLIVHARKAWLSGLPREENRDVPPLDYERVYRLKAALPVFVVLNGGIAVSLRRPPSRSGRRRDDGARRLPGARGGSSRSTRFLFGAAAPFASPAAAAQALIPYIERELERGTRFNAITPPMCSDCFAACRARAPFGVTSRPRGSSRARGSERARRTWSPGQREALALTHRGAVDVSGVPAGELGCLRV